MFISNAYAQTATTSSTGAATAAPSTSDTFIQMLPPLGMAFLVMYFLIIRPQQKQQKEQKAMMNALMNGNEIITASGIHAKIVDASQDVLSVQIAPGVNIQLERAQVQIIKGDKPDAKAKK